MAKGITLLTCDDAYDLLCSLGAPERLLRHARLVGEAVDQLTMAFEGVGTTCDARFIQIGVVHDAGEVLLPQELDNPGSEHELAGRDLMLAHGVHPERANRCVSHAVWQIPGRTSEEILAALPDKLWKGARDQRSELLVIDAAATRMGRTRWDIYVGLDAVFEEIAADASARLSRS